MSYDVIASQPIVVDNVSCVKQRERAKGPSVRSLKYAPLLPNLSSPRGLALLKQVLLGKITQRFTSTVSKSIITQIISNIQPILFQ